MSVRIVVFVYLYTNFALSFLFLVSFFAVAQYNTFSFIISAILTFLFFGQLLFLLFSIFTSRTLFTSISLFIIIRCPKHLNCFYLLVLHPILIHCHRFLLYLCYLISVVCILRLCAFVNTQLSLLNCSMSTYTTYRHLDFPA